MKFEVISFIEDFKGKYCYGYILVFVQKLVESELYHLSLFCQDHKAFATIYIYVCACVCGCICAHVHVPMPSGTHVCACVYMCVCAQACAWGGGVLVLSLKLLAS